MCEMDTENFFSRKVQLSDLIVDRLGEDGRGHRGLENTGS